MGDPWPRTWPVATGENLFFTADVRNLVRCGGLRPRRDIVQMDPGLSYGLTEYIGMLDVLETKPALSGVIADLLA